MGRYGENPPNHKRCGIVRLDVAEETLWGGVSSSRPYAALYLEGYFMFDDSIVKTPFPDGVKFILLDNVNMEVCFADDCENVPYFLLIRRLSAFLLRLVCLLIHRKMF